MSVRRPARPISSKLQEGETPNSICRKKQQYNQGPATTTVMLQLAFQSIGIVYGDMGTSPLYVFSSTFTDGIKHKDDILGVLSLIFYTITLIPLLKYVFIVLQANHNGHGGTFALYSMICRYAEVGLIPKEQIEEAEMCNCQLELLPNNKAEMKRASKLKSKLENSYFMKLFLLFVTMLGTSMVIGDGVLTPCISVLSAVGGIKQATNEISNDLVVLISVGILICLFMVQRFGTDKVAYTFAPLICVWFTFIAGIGLYNLIKYDPMVIKAINPKYILDYFSRNKKDAWISLGGVVLAITGTEALFADVGHFAVKSIQLSMCFVTYPALLLAYGGQASFLRKNNHFVSDTFFKSIPDPLFWPMFVISVVAATIASQAMISGTFSIIQQSLSLGCFPPVRIVHTSTKHEGQVYVPQVNYILMIACVATTLAFKTTTRIGNAYGVAVMLVMIITSAFLVLIMILIWKIHILLVISFMLIIGSLELVYLTAVLYKFDQGGYLTLAFAAMLMTIMYVWNKVYRMRYFYEQNHKVLPEKLQEIVSDKNLCRVPGLAVFHSELVQGSISPIFKHYVANVTALHSVLIFVTIKSLPVSRVPMEEQFLFSRAQPKDLNVFICVVRNGYTDVRDQREPFEKLLVERLKEFIVDELLCLSQNVHQNVDDEKSNIDGAQEEASDEERVQEGIEIEIEEVIVDGAQERVQEAIDKEIEAIEKASRAGVVHLIGEHEVVASKGANIGKRILIDGYNFLNKNLGESPTTFDIPCKRMVKVGMKYEL